MEIKTVIKNLPTNESPEIYPTQSLPENGRGKKTHKLILQGYHHSDNKTRQKCHTHTHTHTQNLQANVTEKHRFKNLQQNSTESNI